MRDLRFLEAAQDPTLIPGVYNTCDQWCAYCPATARCLAYRLSPPEERNDIYWDILKAMREAMFVLKARHEEEGHAPPEALLRLLAETSKPVEFEMVDDQLERMGRRYAQMARAFLASGEPVPVPATRRPDGPTPHEVVLYYHVMIATKIYRAVISGRTAARTRDADARYDADVSAKIALLGIDRSEEALQVMTLDNPDPRIDHMRRHLRQLRREAESRFPAARALVREGLDDPHAVG